MGNEGVTAKWYPRLLAGQLSLDFVNSVDPRTGEHPRDSLGDYADLVGWARHANILNEVEARSLLNGKERRPEQAAAVFARAIDLRETLYRVFLPPARHAVAARGDLDALRGAYRDALGHAELVALDYGYAWKWREGDDALDRPLWPIIRSAIGLLTTPGVTRVKECDNHGCGWLFLDTSKNGRRRWCSMEGCGSQVKMRRYYARRRAAATAE